MYRRVRNDRIGIVYALLLAACLVALPPQERSLNAQSNAALASAASSTKADVRAELLEGVEQLPVTGVPGSLCVFDDDAVPLVVGTADNSPAVFAAASTLGNGRLVALGHNGVFGAEALEHPGMARFTTNAARWAAGRVRKSAKPRAVVMGSQHLKPLLESAGFDVAMPKQAELLKALAQANVGFLVPDAIAAHAKEVEIFVRRGGGLIVAIPAWGWHQGNSSKSLTRDFGPNLVFPKAGIAWTAGTISGRDGAFHISDAASPLLNASRALDLLIRQANTDVAKLSKAQRTELALAASQVQLAAGSIPETDKLLLPRLRQAVANVSRFPTEERPLRLEHGLARVAVTMQVNEALSLPAARVRAHPAAAAFPGEVPATARRVKRLVTIDSASPGWHSTGLYAAPGQVVHVTLPAGAVKAGLNVQIGSHSDQLWHHDQWRRVPHIVRSFPLTEAATHAANAFGGLIYVVVPRNAKLGALEVAIDQAVEAPLFVLGKTDLDEWRKTIRNRPAPWGEVASGKLVITVPSERLRDLDDPEALMRWWDAVLDAQADLATIPRDRERPERVVVDVQISAGWLHAGYPIMGHMVHGREAVDLPTLSTKGSWGYFHEFGHNHQEPEWNFENTGEVTVNLFSLYCYDTLLPDASLHPAFQPDDALKKLQEYRTGDEKFPRWNLFTGLLMYRQLEQEFGWDAYKKVFAEYRALPPEQRPKTNDEKRDQWMVRFSRAVGRNLGPFFEWWAVPTSQAARDSIRGLPVWMPTDLVRED